MGYLLVERLLPRRGTGVYAWQREDAAACGGRHAVEAADKLTTSPSQVPLEASYPTTGSLARS